MPSASVIPIWISEGLLLESRPDQMENFKNVDPQWADVPFDPGRRYTVPWQWGTTGVTVNKSVYAGDPNTSAILLPRVSYRRIAELIGVSAIRTSIVEPSTCASRSLTPT